MSPTRREFIVRTGAALGAATAGAGGSAFLAPRRVLAAFREHSGRVDPYLLVLGIAQDGGMPQVGCYADRCQRARERVNPRFAASLALVDPDRDRYYLVDATPDITRQLDLIDEPGFRERAGERRLGLRPWPRRGPLPRLSGSPAGAERRRFR